MRLIRRHLPKIASLVLTGMLAELVFPIGAYALTGGPSQPEVESFEPYGTTEMVDLFTGDFVYNIPLGDVGGYPMNLAYHGGVGMEQEASWVGLGWNFNPGVVNRSMKGLPDEFHGDDDFVKQEYSVKPNITFELESENVGVGKKEVFGIPKNGDESSINLGIYYNNYKGVGYRLSSSNNKVGKYGKLDMSFNSQESSLSLSPSISDRNLKVGFTYSGSRGIESANVKQTMVGQKEWNNMSTSNTFYANPSYVPFSNPNMYNVHFALSFAYGKHFSGLFTSKLPLRGIYSQFGVKEEEKSRYVPAFGYMYTSEGYEKEDAVLDYNRENENKPAKKSVSLGVPQLTNDFFNVSAQGTGGNFRAYLSSAATVSDPKNSEISVPGANLGIEFGNGALIYNHYGFDVGLSIDWAKNFRWKINNDLEERMTAQKKTQEGGFEPWYFKMAGEKTQIDQEYFNGLMNEELVFPKLKNSFKLDDANTHRNVTNGVGAYPTEKPIRGNRELRNTPVLITQVQDKDWCFQTSLEDWSWIEDNGKISEMVNSISRDMGDRKARHITQVESRNPDGTRYIYGIPAYNWKQKEVTFAIDDKSTRSYRKRDNVCHTKGLVAYASADASLDNDKGIDHLYQGNEISPYPHSFLLTSVLSADYLDVTGNGPSSDDYGSYTRFNYSKKHDNYKWRTPYSQNLDASGNPINGGTGRHVEGYISDPTDDKVSYVYGEKEYWILHSIETKTHIALFITSDREDGLDSESELGGLGSNKMQKLDKIIVLTRAEYEENSTDLSAATPEKVIHFQYDYSLCQGIPNNSGASVDDPDNPGNNINYGGKLTLKKIWFTYGKNEKGKFNAYQFDYDSAVNYDYDPLSQDGWGNYKQNSCGYTSTKDLPYVEQNKQKADLYASAWSLSQISLPSGGKIKVEYESDDYAFVQDQKAMTMFDIVGFGETDHIADANGDLYSRGIQKRTRRFLFFNIDQSINSVSELEELFPIPQSGKLFYKMLVDLTGKQDYEYVSGYAFVTKPDGASSHMGLSVNGSGTKFGWIYVNQVDALDGYDIHPVSHAAFQMIRTELPHLVFPSSDALKSETKALNIFRGLASIVPKVYSTAVGMTNYMLTKNMARKVKLDGSSVIRLYAHNNIKYGGGARVKEIRFLDEWNAITGTEKTSETGMRYSYSKTDGEKSITSGVAAFEPYSILDECALYKPIDEYTDNFLLKNSMSNEFVVSGPVGKDYYPAPTVGYSRVEVRSITPQEIYEDPTIKFKRHDNGYTVHEFYTAKDFPVKTEVSEPEVKKSIATAGKIIKLLTGVDIGVRAISQGFKIMVNDMHGKPRSVAEYSKLNPEKPIRRETTYYKVKDQNAEAKELDNHVNVLTSSGKLEDATEAIIGEEIELIYDNNHNERFTLEGDVEMNLDIFPLFIVPPPTGPIPWPCPSIFPSIKELSYQQLNTSSTAKLVRKYGLVDHVTVENESASITSYNEAYDAITGQVLLTKTETEYKDYLYNLDYPAYWAYDEMGPSAGNHRFTFSISNGGTTSGQADINKSLYNILAEGDVVRINSGPGGAPSKAWLLTKSIEKNPGNICDENAYIYHSVFIDEEGKLLPDGAYSMEIMESGRKNMQAMAMANTVSLSDPLDYTNKTFGATNQFDKVLSSSAVGYTNKRRLYEEQYQFVRQPKVIYKNWVPVDFFLWAIYEFNTNFTSPNLLTDSMFMCQPAGQGTSTTYANNNGSGFENYVCGKISTHYSGSYPEASYLRWVPRIISPDEMIVNIYPFDKNVTDIDDSPIQFRVYKNPNATPAVNWPQNSSLSDIIPGQVYHGTFANASDGIHEFIMGNFSGDPYAFTATNTFHTQSFYTRIGNNEFTWWIVEFPFWPSSFIQECDLGVNGPILSHYSGLRVNPYLAGVKTAHTQDRAYGYYDITTDGNQRHVDYPLTSTPLITDQINLKESGYLADFKPFYTPDCKAEGQFYAQGGANATGYYPWVETMSSTLLNPQGLVHEMTDAKGVNTSKLYGYNQTLPIAMGVNAKYNELASSNFEETYDPAAGKERYNLKWNMHIPYPYTEDLTGNLASISTEYSHSGNASMKVPEGGRVSGISDLISPTISGTYPNYTPSSLEYVLGADDLILGFRPEAQETYTISYWVKGNTDGSELVLQSNVGSPTRSYQDLLTGMLNYQLNPSCSNSNTMTIPAANFQAYYAEEGNSFWNASALSQTSVKVAEIEGWVLRKVSFTVPSGITHLKFTFNNVNGDDPIYVDDFRVFPSDGAMEAYVFDSLNRRMLAKLDENNYATFYEYDEEGKLVRVKRETERGIITLSENRRNIRRN